MGAPKRNEVLKPFAVGELSAALSLARETAKNFDQPGAHAALLERLRILLQPMTEWLDISVNDWLKYHYGEDATQISGTKRVLPLFGYFDKRHVVGLSRDGSWVTYSPNKKGIVPISSEAIVHTISYARFDILKYPERDLAAFESAAMMKPVIEHAAFLAYLKLGLESISKALKEREERLRIMRGNLSSLQLFTEGADPLAYNAAGPLPGYSMFCETERGHSRCTGTYLVREAVEEQVIAKNNAAGNNSKYFVFNDSRQPSSLKGFLFHLGALVRETAENGSCGRKPFSDEEISLLQAYVGSFCILPDNQ